MRFRLAVGALLVAGTLAAPGGRPHPEPQRIIPIPYTDARPVLETMADALPPELSGRSPAELEAAWLDWVRRRNAEIRARLERGDEDSIVNLMLFGTRFTSAPRITSANLARLAAASQDLESKDPAELAGPLILSRAEDLVRAAASPGEDGRLVFVRQALDSKGFSPSTLAGAAKARVYLIESLRRVLHEQEGYRQTLEAARALGDPTEEFAQRSTLYRNRGLSLDTSLLPNLAIERSLAELKSRGLLPAGGVRRVGVIGPGLDFTDKSAGYDFYPQQTVQPFALLDSLLRLGLARAEQIELTTLDLSPRVNSHIAQLRGRARRGLGYVIQLPLPADVKWQPESVAYWKRFGDQIGAPATPAKPPPGAGRLEMRAIRVRSGIASRLRAADLNVVLERLDITPTESGFDLIIATNILVYYDVFEQSLALRNIAAMLRPGGFLLSNNALLELPVTPIRSIGNQTTVYSDRANDGDHIVWYQCSAPLR